RHRTGSSAAHGLIYSKPLGNRRGRPNALLMNVSDAPEVTRHSSGLRPRAVTRSPHLGYGGTHLLSRWLAVVTRAFNNLVDLFRIPPPVTSQVLRRIELLEQHIILPIKAAWIAILLRPANYSWIGEQATNLEVNPTSAYCVFWSYVA